MAAPRATFARPLSSSLPRMFANEREHDTAPAFREDQKSKPATPHMTNTSSTISNEMPSVGADKAPPELLTSVDPDFVPKDSVPENTERMTGGTQAGHPKDGVNAELGVGEMEGAEFKVEPLRRTGEDANTMRARLLCLFDLGLVTRQNNQRRLTYHFCPQIRVAKEGLSKVTFSCLPLPT